MSSLSNVLTRDSLEAYKTWVKYENSETYELFLPGRSRCELQVQQLDEDDNLVDRLYLNTIVDVEEWLDLQVTNSNNYHDDPGENGNISEENVETETPTSNQIA